MATTNDPSRQGQPVQQNQQPQQSQQAQPSQPSQFTPLAKRYTHPTTDNHISIRGIEPFKSGMTPLYLSSPSTGAERGLHRKLERYQRARFETFTAADLHDLECFTPWSALTLGPRDENWLRSIPIHPIFDIANWDMPPKDQHLAEFPVRDGTDGLYVAHNPIVWRELEPCLKLASLFLTNTNIWPWWDAFFKDQHTVIPQSEIPPNAKHDVELKRFKLRAANIRDSQEARNGVQDCLTYCAGRIGFSLFSGWLDSESHLQPVDPRHYSYGLTAPAQPDIGHINVWISFEMLEPLVKRNIHTEAERVLDRWRVASTILHETAHAIWKVYHLGKAKEPPEPYFHDEPYSELGWSMENSLFNGVTHPMVHDYEPKHGLSCGGVYEMKYPIQMAHNSNHLDARAPCLNTKPPWWDLTIIYPCAVSWFFDIHKLDFWETHVKKYGDKSTYRGPKVEGRSIDGSLPPIDERYANGDIIETEQIPIDYSTMNDEEVRAVTLENERRSRVTRLRQMTQLVCSRVGTAVRSNNNADLEPPNARNLKPGEKQEPPRNPLTDARFNTIRDYLINNRRQLALDTMETWMPEHVMYAHIIRNGGLQLGVDEWRQFLWDCDVKGTLFVYYPDDGYGMLQRIYNGWPPNQSPPVQYQAPRSELWVFFQDKILPKFREREQDIYWLWDDPKVHGEYSDLDAETFRAMCNWFIKNQGQQVRSLLLNGQPELTTSQIDELIDMTDKRKGWMTFGPKGVYRVRKSNWKLPQLPLTTRVNKKFNKLNDRFEDKFTRCKQQ